MRNFIPRCLVIVAFALVAYSVAFQSITASGIAALCSLIAMALVES